MTGIITTKEQLKTVVFEVLTDALKAARQEPPEKLFTMAQAAAKLGKSRQTIYNMVNAGRLQTTADGKYISQQSINNYLNTQK